MKWDYLFRSVKSGGLGLRHLFLSQIVSKFLFLHDQGNPFLRTVLQTKLASFAWWTHDNYTTHLVGYYKEVVESFAFLNARFTIEYLSIVSRKKLLRDLRDTFSRSIARSNYFDGPGQDVLCRAKKMCIPPSVKTVFFKLPSSTLPVKSWLEQKGMFVAWSVDYHICKLPESIDHIFVEYWDAMLFWDVLKRTVKKDLHITPHSIRFLPFPQGESVPYDLFIILGVYSLWKSRMNVRHANGIPLPIHVVFLQCITQVKAVLDTFPVASEWASVLDEVLAAKWP